MAEFLRLQTNQLPSALAAEEMTQLIVDQEERSGREQLWEFEPGVYSNNYYPSNNFSTLIEELYYKYK